MWHCTKSPGNCAYSEKADETDIALRRGIGLDEAALEVRRAKGAIQKVLVLDKYVEFVKHRVTPSDRGVDKDVFLNSLKGKGLAWNEMFHMSMGLFVELCKKQNYKAFVKEHRAVAKFKLASILGLRESVLEKVVNRTKSLSRKKAPVAVDKSKQATEVTSHGKQQAHHHSRP